MFGHIPSRYHGLISSTCALETGTNYHDHCAEEDALLPSQIVSQKTCEDSTSEASEIVGPDNDSLTSCNIIAVRFCLFNVDAKVVTEDFQGEDAAYIASATDYYMLERIRILTKDTLIVPKE